MVQDCMHAPIRKYLTAPSVLTLVFSSVFALALGESTAYAQEPIPPVADPIGPSPGFVDPIPESRPVSSGCGSPGQTGYGFVVQTNMGGRLLAVAAADADAFGSGLQWNLMLGYKICRVVVGVGIDVAVESPAGTSKTNTAFILEPEVQIAMARSADRRAELLGVIGLGLGSAGGNLRVNGKLAPGVRYWVHRHIALNTLVGFSGDLVYVGKNQAALLSLFGTVGVLGAF